MKKLFGIIAIAAIAAVAGWNFIQSNNEVELSDLALANINALADEEWGGGKYCQWDATNKYCTRKASGPVCLLTDC